MKKILTLATATILTCNFLFSQINVTREWVQRYNSPDSLNEIAVAFDVHRHLFVLGYKVSDNSIILIKYSSSGAQLWVVEYPDMSVSASQFSISPLAVDAQCNAYVTGTVDQNLTTLKFSGSGTLQWTHSYDYGGVDEGSAVALDKEGAIYVTGTSQDSSEGNNDLVTLKLDATGSQQWVARYDAGGNETGKHIAVDKDKNTYVCGAAGANSDSIVLVKYDSSGTQQWARSYADATIFEMKEDGKGNIYLGGTSSTQLYFLLLRYDSNGNFHWAAIYNGGQQNGQINALAIDSQGNPVVTGQSVGSSGTDYATIKYDTSGTVLWVQRYDGPENAEDFALDVVMDTTGDVYVTGNSQGEGRSVDLGTLKYRGTDGQQLWEERYQTIANAEDGFPFTGAGIVADADSNIYVIGTGQGIQTGQDIILIKYNQSALCKLVADAGEDQTICADSCVMLNGSDNGATYSWSPSAGLSDSSISNPQACPSVTTSYTLTVTNGGACSDTDVVTVTVVPLVGSPGALSGPACVLRGGTYSYSVTIANASSYLWSYSGTGAAISGNTNPVTITFSCTATNGYLSVKGVNSCGNGSADSLSITTNAGATINVYSSKYTIGPGCHPSTVKSAIMPIDEAGTKLGFKVFRSNKIGMTAKRRNFDNIWNGNCVGVNGSCSYDPASNVTANVNVTEPVLVNQGGGPSYKYTITVPAGKRYLVIAKYDADTTACAIYSSGEPPCYIYPGKRTHNRNNHHDQCDEDDEGDDDGDDDDHFTCCESKNMFLTVIQDAKGKIRPGNTDAVLGSLLLICSPNYVSFTDTVELLPVIYESVEGSWDVSANANPPEGFYSVPDTSISTQVSTSLMNTLQFTLVDTGSVWTNTVVTTRLKHEGRNIIHYSSPGMIDNTNSSNYLSQNFPNPFTGSTKIPYFLPVACNVNLTVYDIMGKQMVTLVDGIQHSGQYTKTWNGCDNTNSDLPGGVYFVCLKATSLDNKRLVLNSKTMLYIK